MTDAPVQFWHRLAPRWSVLGWICVLAGLVPACQMSLPELTPGAGAPTERELQRASDDILARFGGEFRDAAVQAYVEQVGRRILAQTPIEPDHVEFVLLDTDIANAFVVPGATIFVTRGLLGWLNSEAELASVIAHEVAHLTEDHAIEQRDAVRDAEQRAVARGLLDLDGEVALALRRYSREQELEADRIGLGFLVAAGYPGAATQASQDQFDARDRVALQLRGIAADLPTHERAMATHPSSQQRIATLAGLPEFASTGDDQRESYLAAVDGIPFGPNAFDWRIAGDRIVQPSVGIEFRRPDGYAFAASGGILSGGGPGEGFVTIDFGVRDPSTSPAAYLNRQFARFDTTPSTTEMFGGYPGAAMAFSLEEDGHKWHLIVGAVGIRGDALMRVLAIAPADDEGSLRRAFDSIVTGLERTTLGPNVVARNLAIATVQPGDDVSSLAAHMAVDQAFDDHAETLFRAINGLEHDEGVQAGQQVKLVE